ncbi:MAG: hypothetical protein DHS20C18_56310 [Saprospiraceae bacterium]|nr:MAG: hypothetical protein DHS20C18_56310 [Saprospiraceae bacterium]
MPSFEELADLANLVQPNKIKNLELVGSADKPVNKMDIFYHGLADQTLTNDREAAQQLYESGPNYPAYYKLKERLYE